MCRFSGTYFVNQRGIFFFFMYSLQYNKKKTTWVNSKTDNQYFQVTLLLQIWVIFFFLKSWSLLMCSKIWFFFSHHKSNALEGGAPIVFLLGFHFLYIGFFFSRTLSKISLFHLTVVFKTQEYSPLSLCIHKNEGKRVGQINQTCFSNPYPY